MLLQGEEGCEEEKEIEVRAKGGPREKRGFYRNYMMGREAIIGMMDGPGAPLCSASL